MSKSTLNVDGRGRSLVRGSGGTRSKSRRKGGVQCFYCEKFGHIKRDCPECGNRNKGDSPGSGAAIVAAQKE